MAEDKIPTPKEFVESLLSPEAASLDRAYRREFLGIPVAAREPPRESEHHCKYRIDMHHLMNTVHEVCVDINVCNYTQLWIITDLVQKEVFTYSPVGKREDDYPAILQILHSKVNVEDDYAQIHSILDEKLACRVQHPTHRSVFRNYYRWNRVKWEKYRIAQVKIFHKHLASIEEPTELQTAMLLLMDSVEKSEIEFLKQAHFMLETLDFDPMESSWEALGLTEDKSRVVRAGLPLFSRYSFIDFKHFAWLNDHGFIGNSYLPRITSGPSGVGTLP